VLYFDREAKEADANTVYALRPGEEIPMKVGGTSSEDLRAAGLDSTKCFKLYDDAHTFATNFTQADDAIGGITTGKNLIQSAFFQGAIRLRKLTGTQTCVLLVSKSVAQALHGKIEGIRIEEVVFSAMANQVVRLADATAEASKMGVRQVLREHPLQQLLDATSFKQIQRVGARNRGLLCTENPPLSYKTVGRLTPKVPFKDALEAEWEFYKRRCVEDNELAALQEKVVAHIDAASKLPQAPTRVPVSTRLALGKTVVLERSTEGEGVVENMLGRQQELQLEQQLDVEKEIEQQAQIYNGDIGGSPRYHEVWRPQDLKYLLAWAQRGTQWPLKCPQKNWRSLFQVMPRKLYSVSSLFSRWGPTYVKYDQAYGRIFTATDTVAVYVDSYWAQPFENFLPIFHPEHSDVSGVMVIRRSDAKIVVIILPLPGLQRCRDYLGELRKNGKHGQLDNVWMMMPDGSLLDNVVQGSQDLEANVAREVFTCLSVLNGNVMYLLRNEAKSKVWLDERPLARRYLKLMLRKRSPSQRSLVMQSSLFSSAQDSARARSFLRRKLESAIRYVRNQKMYAAGILGGAAGGGIGYCATLLIPLLFPHVVLSLAALFITIEAVCVIGIAVCAGLVFSSYRDILPERIEKDIELGHVTLESALTVYAKPPHSVVPVALGANANVGAPGVSAAIARDAAPAVGGF